MKEYIERADALKANIHVNGHNNTSYKEAKEREDAIKSIPAADVVEARHGKWVSVGAITRKCSECRHNELKTRADEYLYCPSCGALMDKEDNNA